MTFIIKYANHEVTVFTIDNNLFYLCQVGIPQLFDSDLKLQVVPNIDNWFQFKTQQRYSYRNVCDMSIAFASGLQHSYTCDDFVEMGKQVVDKTIKTVFQTENTREFSQAYWIELLDPGKLQKLIEAMRSDLINNKYDSEELYNILCRLWQFSNFYAPSESAVFETLIRTRLYRLPQIPKYPETSHTDLKIEELVIKNLFGKVVSQFKGISDELINNVRRIQTRRLHGSDRVRTST